VLRSVPTILAG